MSVLRARRAIARTALKFGVSYDEVYREIEAVIAEMGKANHNASQSLWAAIPQKGEIPSPEEFILFIAESIGQ